jgi:hypothetical protein
MEKIEQKLSRDTVPVSQFLGGQKCLLPKKTELIPSLGWTMGTRGISVEIYFLLDNE